MKSVAGILFMIEGLQVFLPTGLFLYDDSIWIYDENYMSPQTGVLINKGGAIF